MNWPKRKWLDDRIEQVVLDVLRYYRERSEDMPAQSHFEQIYCDHFVNYQGGNGFTDAVNSGTSALYIALAAIGACENDLVLTSPVTDFGSVSAMALHKLKIEVADSSKESFNTSLEYIREIYSPKLKGLILTHSAGDPISDIDEIASLCQEKGIWLIEDCSQAHGAIVNGQKVGSFGDIAIFSTMHSKNHSSGGSGGLIYTQSKGLYNLIRSHADRGKLFHRENFNSKSPEFIGSPALNLGSNEISCAIGNETLYRLDDVIKKRREFLQSLDKRIKEESLPLSLRMDLQNSSPYFCPVLITDPKTDVKKLKEKLVEINFPCNPHYSYIVSEWDWAKKYLAVSPHTPNATHFRDQSFNLLFNENFNAPEVERIISLWKEVI